MNTMLRTAQEASSTAPAATDRPRPRLVSAGAGWQIADGAGWAHSDGAGWQVAKGAGWQIADGAGWQLADAAEELIAA